MDFKKIFLTWVLVLAACGPSGPKAPYRPSRTLDSNDYLTAGNSVMCFLPSSIQEGLEAAAASDDKWLQQAGCVSVPKGLIARRIDPYLESPGTWQVHLYVSADVEQTLYVASCELKRLDGTQVGC